VIPLKTSLKRGALVTAANWEVVVIQFVADAIFKTLLAVPIVGGVFLVALLVGGDPSELLNLPVRSIIPTMTSALLAQPLALGAFLFSVAVVLAGGSLLMFFVKGGTVNVLVAAERDAGAIEHPPLRLPAFRRAARYSLERFAAGAQTFFPRYVCLGGGLLVVYGATTLGSLGLLLRPAAESEWGMTALLSLVIVFWITVVNLLYLLLQMIVGSDDCGVAEAVGRLVRLIRARFRVIVAIFAATLVMVVLTTAASILATAAFGLIAFVPLMNLAAVSLQVIAWVVRGLVFEFIGLTALVAYLRIYRETREGAERQALPNGSHEVHLHRRAAI
jgi:hypothetical protein